MINDHSWVISLEKEYTNKQYVFYVEQVQVGESATEGGWEGRIGKLRQVI
jgi:hypothetical protein